MSADFPTRIKPKLDVETKVSIYDRLNAALIACIVIAGFLFAALFLIWLTTAIDFSRRAAGPIVVANEMGDSKPEGVSDDILVPGVDEFPELEEQQLASKLELVNEAVSSVRASLEASRGSAVQMGTGRGYGSREGGPGKGGDAIPEYKRWIINYESDDINVYAKQLSFFGIDIGVIHQTRNDIWRVHDVGGTPSVIETNREREHETLRFAHKKMRMQRWDRQLCKRAGVDLNNTLQAQFYSKEARQQIRQAEAAALEVTGKTLVEVKNTIFKVVPAGNGFEFVVIDFLYR